MGRSRREVAAGGKGTSPQVPPKAPAAGDALHPERQSSATELGSEAFRGLPPGLPFSAGGLSLSSSVGGGRIFTGRWSR